MCHSKKCNNGFFDKLKLYINWLNKKTEEGSKKGFYYISISSDANKLFK